MDIRSHTSKIVGAAVAVAALSLSFGGWALASHNGYTKAEQNNTAPTANPNATPIQGSPEEGTAYGDDIYRVIDGVVYEWDDGWWEPQYDKKIENGIVYDFDDGRWRVEYDPSVQKSTPQPPKTTPQAPAQNNAPKQNNPAPKQNPAPNNTYPNSKYKVENGVVYEWDDGRWEPEHDKKSENGVFYEYDDGYWEVDDDAYDWDD